MLKLTPEAAEQIKQVTPPQNDNEALALRIAARTLPNGEIDYGMGFDEQREFDLEIAIHGINLLIGPNSRDLLDNITLDFVELEPGQFHFIFIPSTADSEQQKSESGA